MTTAQAQRGIPGNSKPMITTRGAILRSTSQGPDGQHEAPGIRKRIPASPEAERPSASLPKGWVLARDAEVGEVYASVSAEAGTLKRRTAAGSPLLSRKATSFSSEAGTLWRIVAAGVTLVDGVREAKLKCWDPAINSWVTLFGSNVPLTQRPEFLERLPVPPVARTRSGGTRKASTPREPVNEATGYRPKALGNLVGVEYLASKTVAEAVERATKVLTEHYKGKGDADPEAHAAREAKIWTKILPERHADKFAALPPGKAAAKKSQKKGKKAAAKKPLKAKQSAAERKRAAQRAAKREEAAADNRLKTAKA